MADAADVAECSDVSSLKCDDPPAPSPEEEVLKLGCGDTSYCQEVLLRLRCARHQHIYLLLGHNLAISVDKGFV